MPARDEQAGLTIAEVLSWLNYGGVESYALRLALALKRRGHRVIVASSGGQLVPKLEASGIEHFRIDFTGTHLLPGLYALRRLLETEQVDLVNAHNWRAGMVSYLACRLAGVPYLLTIHGTRSPANRYGVFYWSTKVVSVSGASRRNLIQGFGLPPDRVVPSMIGVDCDRFHPQPRSRALEHQLGLHPDARRVVHVSRFSRGKTPVALALIKAIEALDKEVPGVELVIVGQGPEERAVAGAAEGMNRKLGRQAVIFLGGRWEVPQILSLADVVVGTASVALEAMASGKPVVAAGKGGYLGIVRPENVAQAEESCFADHESLAPVAPERLASDVGRLLRDRGEAAQLAEFGRRRAETAYHVSKLAEEMETIYRAVLSDRENAKRLLVLHLNQIGDLLFTLPALKALREAFPQAHITSVLRPHLAALIQHSGLVDDIVHRPVGSPARAVRLGLQLRRLRPDLAVVFSQSATMALCARLSGARHRIGYVDSDASRLLNHRVQVRGIPCPEKVMRLVCALGLQPEKTDYVGLVTLSEADHTEGARLIAGCWPEPTGPLIALAPGEAAARPYKAWTADGFRGVAAALAADSQARLLVVGAKADRELGDDIIAGLGASACNLAGRTTPAQLAAVLARCDLLIGIDSGPMHLAAAMGTPVVALFGPTDPHRTGPQGEGHEVIFHPQPCWGPCVHPVVPKCRHRRCMSAITVEEVLGAARRVLTRQARTGTRALHRAH